MKETKFYICKHCGNLIEMVHNAGVSVVCCGEKMTEPAAGAVDAAREKHVPVVSVSGDMVTVSVGEVTHPMTEEHNIAWVYLLTDKGGHRKNLVPGASPEVSFALIDETPICVYAYCNLHGLWKKDI